MYAMYVNKYVVILNLSRLEYGAWLGMCNEVYGKIVLPLFLEWCNVALSLWAEAMRSRIILWTNFKSCDVIPYLFTWYVHSIIVILALAMQCFVSSILGLSSIFELVCNL